MDWKGKQPYPYNDNRYGLANIGLGTEDSKEQSPKRNDLGGNNHNFWLKFG